MKLMTDECGNFRHRLLLISKFLHVRRLRTHPSILLGFTGDEKKEKNINKSTFYNEDFVLFGGTHWSQSSKMIQWTVLIILWSIAAANIIIFINIFYYNYLCDYFHSSLSYHFPINLLISICIKFEWIQIEMKTLVTIFLMFIHSCSDALPKNTMDWIRQSWMWTTNPLVVGRPATQV